MIFRRGLWSTMTVSFLLPRVKWRILWKALARASPSTGAYLDFVPVVNLLPANSVGQLDLHHTGTLASILQCFWVRWKLIPVLLHSVLRAVVIPGVKDLMPPFMTSAI